MISKTHSPSALDDFGYAPIHYAAMCGFSAAIELFSSKETKSKDGESFMMCAAAIG